MDEWHKIDDASPYVGEEYLIRIKCVDHFNIENATYLGDGLWRGCWCDIYGKEGSCYKVTHIMDVPDDPEED